MTRDPWGRTSHLVAEPPRTALSVLRSIPLRQALGAGGFILTVILLGVLA